MAQGWRAYYSDGRTFASSDVAWYGLPREGLVGVVEFLEPPYRRIIDGHDWIYMESGTIRAATTHPDWGEWADEPKIACRACVKRGAAMDDDAWADLQRRMFEDRTWP